MPTSFKKFNILSFNVSSESCPSLGEKVLNTSLITEGSTLSNTSTLPSLVIFDSGKYSFKKSSLISCFRGSKPSAFKYTLPFSTIVFSDKILLAIK